MPSSKAWTVVEWVRGSLSLPAIIVLWAGLWLLCDNTIPGGMTNVVKQVALLGLGMWSMLRTKVFFASAYMERLDHDGSLKHMSKMLREKRGPRKLDWLKFYAKSVVAMTGIIWFWNGCFNLTSVFASLIKWPLVAQLAAALGGAASVMCVMYSEDAAAEARDDVAFIKDAAHGTLQAFSDQPLLVRAMLVAKALLCNAGQVVLWWGVEGLVEDAVPGTAWSAITMMVVGLLVLKLVDRLDVNLGLADNADDSEAESQPDGGLEHGGSGRSALWTCLLNGVELVAVVLLWTGFEWFIWDDYLCANTPVRNALYTLGGFAVLVATGTFVTMAGVVSPMAMYTKVHRHLQLVEVVPLLASSPAAAHTAAANLFWSPHSDHHDELTPGAVLTELRPLASPPGVGRLQAMQSPHGFGHWQYASGLEAGALATPTVQ